MKPETDLRGSEPPPPAAILEVRLDDEVTIPVRRYGNPDGPRLLVSHGNGLAIDLYYPFWSLFLDDFDVVVFDLRNHGENPPGAIARHTIPTFCRDLEAVGQAVDRTFGMRPRAGVFHSVSCLAALLSPALEASYAALVLFEPPLSPGAGAARASRLACRQAAARTRIRAFRFQSREEFVELMAAQPAMARLGPGALRLMARTTLRRAAGGGWELRCPPDYEARILASLPDFAPLVAPDALPLPVRVVGADPSLPHYFVPPCDLTGVASVDFRVVTGTTHLAQLEQPEECARLTVEFLDRSGFSSR